MFLKLLSAPFSKDMGVDLGTANTLVYVRGKGTVLREPSVVAIQKDTRNILAVGEEAKKMIGRTPGNIVAIRPMKDGVIADFDVTERMLRYFITKTHRRSRLVRPRIIVCVPSGVTEVEKRAVIDATLQAGAREAYLIEEPMAAAIGAGLPVNEPTGNMIVDIGGGTTEVAIISMEGIVASQSIRVGGDEMDYSIVRYVKDQYKIIIGFRTAEEIKIDIGNAIEGAAKEKAKEIRGRDMVTGLPRPIEISAGEIMNALADPVEAIVSAVKMTLERTPPELASDLMDRGIIMAGGGALLAGLDSLLRRETGMPIHIAEEPLECVVKGTGKALEEIDMQRRILRSNQRRLS